MIFHVQPRCVSKPSCKLHQVFFSLIRALGSCLNSGFNTTNFGWRRDKFTKRTQRERHPLPPTPTICPLLKLSSSFLLRKVCDGLNYCRECFGHNSGFCSAVADVEAATPGCSQHGKSLKSTAASELLFRCLERVCKGPDP